MRQNRPLLDFARRLLAGNGCSLNRGSASMSCGMWASPPQTMELLEKRLGIGDACFEGKGISAGDPKCRLFLVKNLPLEDLNYQLYDLGTPQDNRTLP